jgi:hypothetical protein
MGAAAAFSIAFAVTAFLLFRRDKAKRNKLWLAAGSLAACLCLAGCVYVAAALLLINNI